MSKATISVKYTLMLMLITIIIIGLAGIISWLSNMFRLQMCIQEQIKAVNDIEGLVKEVKESGNPILEKIKINGICTDCIWYNESTRQMDIKFRGAMTPVSINVSMMWEEVGLGPGCGNSNMLAGETHYIELTPHNILCVSCS